MMSMVLAEISRPCNTAVQRNSDIEPEETGESVTLRKE
jgi:hypothetical protein